VRRSFVAAARFLSLINCCRDCIARKISEALQIASFRPVPVILAELRAEQISEQSATSMVPNESGDSTTSATSVMFAGSESSSGSGSSSGSSASSSPGPFDLSQSSSGSSTQSFINDPLGSASSMGTSTESLSGSSSRSGSSSSSKKKRLPETDVFGEPPHTGLSSDEVDLVARHILLTARKARCAQEDEYCQLQFRNCKDEKCRRQVEDQASLSSNEKKEISKLLRN